MQIKTELEEAIENYALGLLCEEFGEALQLIGKALRFGIDSVGVKDPLTGHIDTTVTARERLNVELGDALAAIDYAGQRGLVDPNQVAIARSAKIKKLLDPNSRDNMGRRLAP